MEGKTPTALEGMERQGHVWNFTNVTLTKKIPPINKRRGESGVEAIGQVRGCASIKKNLFLRGCCDKGEHVFYRTSRL